MTTTHAPPGTPYVTAAAVIDAAAQLFGVTEEELRGHHREARVLLARHVAMYVVRQLSDYSYPSIAKEFDRVDHGAVAKMVEKVAGWVEAGWPDAEPVDRLMQRLTGRIDSPGFWDEGGIAMCRRVDELGFAGALAWADAEREREEATSNGRMP